MSELNRPPDPGVTEHLYFKQLQHVRPLAEHVALTWGAKYLDVPGEHWLQFLWDAATRYLHIEMEDVMR